MPSNANSDKWTRTVRLGAIVCVLYCIADLALNKYAFGDGWTIIWPLNGITIGVLLLLPRSAWPAVFAGTIIGLGIGERLDGNTMTVVVVERALSAMEVLICALMLPGFTALEQWLRIPKLSLRLYGALLLGPGISGLIYACFAHYVQHQSFLNALNDWATADAIGIAATLPVVLSLRTPEMRGLFRPRNLPKTLGTLGLCFGAVVMIFSVSPYPLSFLLFPVLLLAELLLTFAGASLAALGVCLLAVYLTIHYPGPFIRPLIHSSIERGLVLQVYLGFHLFALFPASIVFLERRLMIRQIEEANVKLTLLAGTDGLTSIANRRSFDDHLSVEWKVAARNRVPLALLMIDIDNFKGYNDAYGHIAGDECLRRVAQMMLTVARRPRDLAARFGGEEFVILLPETSLEAALALAQAYKAEVFNGAIEHSRSSWERVTVSIGCISLVPETGMTFAELLDRADKALYMAKQQGRNTVCSM